MHESAMDKFFVFVSEYLDKHRGAALSVLDIGSSAIGGDSEKTKNHRSHITSSGWKYVGLDIEAGANVDVVVKNPNHYAELEDDCFDVVLCSQVLEHTRHPWVVVSEIARILKPNGLAFLIAPSSGHVHRYPEDCYRYYPDGLGAIGEAAGLVVVDAHVQVRPVYRSNIWLDAVAVLQKPILKAEEEAQARARRQLARLATKTPIAQQDLDMIDLRPRPSASAAPFARIEKLGPDGKFSKRDTELAKRFDPVRRFLHFRRHFSDAIKALTRPI